MNKKDLHFDVSTGLKRVLGQELITDDEVAIFELVKNSFDAGARSVKIMFDYDRIVVADNGSGMSHPSAWRCSETGDETDNRLIHILSYPG